MPARTESPTQRCVDHRCVSVQTTLAVSLGFVTEEPAAMPAGAAGDGTVVLTWEMGAVYKHAATDYFNTQG